MYLFVKKNNVYTSFDLYIWKIFKTAAIDMEDLRIQCIIAVIDVETYIIYKYEGASWITF